MWRVCNVAKILPKFPLACVGDGRSNYSVGLDPQTELIQRDRDIFYTVAAFSCNTFNNNNNKKKLRNYISDCLELHLELEKH